VADIQNERLQSLHTLVQKTNAHVVLKGHQTLVAGPQRPAQVCMQGNSGMGISGMGDVLTGILAGIIAQAKYHQLSIEEALLLAVQIHAMAADSLVQKGIGPLGLTPSEVILEARYLINVKSS
jgi:NAD(P)H-hydrate repair Nnr-like enzyme with NAD(P)H-hydrate dehydratase domain